MGILVDKNNRNTDSARIIASAKRQLARQSVKKTLGYNSREISTQLLRAKKSRNASVVLTRAKGKVASLQRALASGNYNEWEVKVALAHARRMVECSRLKIRNLKEEEKEVRIRENSR